MVENDTGAASVPFPEGEIAAHAEHDHVAAVFADRAAATAAVDELRALGLGSEHLGVAVRGGESVAFEHDAEAEQLVDTEVGLAAGTSIGAIAGLAMAILPVPGVGAIGAGGVLALAGASALWGGLLGGYFGVAAGEPSRVAHADIGYAALEEGEVLVVVCSHGHTDAIRDVMQRHDGTWRVVEPGEL
jgi:hypothetical protein